MIVGDAGTSVKVDAATGEATPEVNPSLVTVVVPSLGINQAVAVGAPIEIPLPEPIGTSVITVAGGTTGTDEAGNTFARASAVRLDLLNGEALQGGIELSLADCLSVAGASVTVTPTTDTTVPLVTPPGLPRTGGGSPNGLALASAVGFAALGAHAAAPHPHGRRLIPISPHPRIPHRLDRTERGPDGRTPKGHR